MWIWVCPRLRCCANDTTLRLVLLQLLDDHDDTHKHVMLRLDQQTHNSPSSSVNGLEARIRYRVMNAYTLEQMMASCSLGHVLDLLPLLSPQAVDAVMRMLTRERSVKTCEGMRRAEVDANVQVEPAGIVFAPTSGSAVVCA